MPSSAHYTSLPSQDDAVREMEEAFDYKDEDDDSHEFTPLNLRGNQQLSMSRLPPPLSVPGSYDFEREYDYDTPPPGSPPQPSATAIPNNYGNSNGLIPTTPVSGSFSTSSTGGSPSFFRRTMGALLPSHYQRVSTTPTSAGVVGGGLQNDGVFANVMAKPGAGRRTVTGEDGNIYLAPEETQKEAPPTYAEAQTDAVPVYWETTVIAPSGLGDPGEMIVEGLPTGSFLLFAFNLFSSYFFQFLGFVITYFLSTTHAAKYGSRAGLGLTFIQYGADWRAAFSGPSGDGNQNQPAPQDLITWNKTESGWQPYLINNSSVALNSLLNAPNSTAQDEYSFQGDFGWNGKDWVALVFMTLGWLLLFSSIIGYWRVKRWEMSIRASSQSSTITVTEEQLERDIEVRRNLELVFGFAADDEEDPRPGTVVVEDARLADRLRAAGLL